MCMCLDSLTIPELVFVIVCDSCLLLQHSRGHRRHQDFLPVRDRNTSAADTDLIPPPSSSDDCMIILPPQQDNMQRTCLKIFSN